MSTEPVRPSSDTQDHRAGSQAGAASGRGYRPGDKVSTRGDDETWNVGSVSATGEVELYRAWSDGYDDPWAQSRLIHMEVTFRQPADLRLEQAAECRSIYPGDGWSDDLFIGETGLTVAEFSARLREQQGNRLAAAAQVAAASFPGPVVPGHARQDSQEAAAKPPQPRLPVNRGQRR